MELSVQFTNGWFVRRSFILSLLAPFTPFFHHSVPPSFLLSTIPCLHFFSFLQYVWTFSITHKHWQTHQSTLTYPNKHTHIHINKYTYVHKHILKNNHYSRTSHTVPSVSHTHTHTHRETYILSLSSLYHTHKHTHHITLQRIITHNHNNTHSTNAHTIGQ